MRRERAEHAEKRAALAEEKQAREADLVRERESLAGQLRAAYLIGSEEPLKLLLNQKDPTRAGRMFAYYSYFGRARAEQIARIGANLARLEQLDGEMAAEDERLAALEAQRRAGARAAGPGARQARPGAGEPAGRRRSRARRALERMKRQQSGLEKLLRELKRAMEKFPVTVDTNTAFGRLRGKLAWPVAGRLVARFGEDRVGGREVGRRAGRDRAGRAVRGGFAGPRGVCGLAAGPGPADHHRSRRGLSQPLRPQRSLCTRRWASASAAGEPVAAAGDSGGRTRPELYFEIRKAGRPVDPRPWFKSGEPSVVESVAAGAAGHELTEISSAPVSRPAIEGFFV